MSGFSESLRCRDPHPRNAFLCGNQNSGAGRARTDDDRIMSSEAMTGSNTVERG